MSKNLIALSAIAGALMLSAAAGSLFAAAKDSGASDEAAPDLSGLWVRTGEPMFEPIPGAKEGKPVARLEVNSKDADEIMAGNWDNPILQPWARDIVKKNADSEVALKHVYQADDSCWPVTVPAILNMREAVQFLQTKNSITILYQRDHQVRKVWLNQKHSAKLEPSWYGESVGHYEGDTLVVDTIGFNDKTFVDNYRTPHTTQLHVVERFRMINDGKSLEVRIAVDDPGAYNMPWTARSTWRRAHPGMLIEDICEPNNDFYFGYEVAPLPHDDHPAF
jgi:hypothetical protein